MVTMIKKRAPKSSARWRSAMKYAPSGKGGSRVRTAVSTYTGSPDSVDVAALLEGFRYCPDKRQKILEKYENM